jgi:hypothetical protein
MCEPFINSYKSKSGVEVQITPNINPNDIPASVKAELEQTPASQLDLLYVRSEMKEHHQELKKIKNAALTNRDELKAIKSNFYVKVKNGKEETRHMSDLILDMYNRETNRRHLGDFINLLSRHKKLVYFLIAVVLLLSLGFHSKISAALSWLSNNLLEVLKLVL